MISQRLWKQINVLFFTLLFLSLCGYGFYIGVLKPKPNCFDKIQNQGEAEIDCGGPCQSCEINHLKPLEFSQTGNYVVQNNKYFLYTRVLNTNKDYGAKTFKYTFTVTLEDGDTQTLQGIDYILPSSGKYVLLTNISLNSAPTQITFNIDTNSIVWSTPILTNIPSKIFSLTNISLKKGENITNATEITQTAPYYNFTKTLKQGSKGEEVKNLQSILANDNEIMEKLPNLTISGTFDYTTYKALIMWQYKNGLKQTGIVDKDTLAKLNELYGRPTSESDIRQTSFNFTKTLKINMKDAEVSDLQRALSLDPTIYPEAQITGTFGALTKRAVERFQTKYGLPVTGIVDEKTRSVLNSIYNKKTTSNIGAISGVNIYIEGTAFNLTPITWKTAYIIGFICNSADNVVGVSKYKFDNFTANSSRTFFLSWNHNLPPDLKICPDGLNIDTNILDKTNWVK